MSTNVDGALVGGASLKAADFLAILLRHAAVTGRLRSNRGSIAGQGLPATVEMRRGIV